MWGVTCLVLVGFTGCLLKFDLCDDLLDVFVGLMVFDFLIDDWWAWYGCLLPVVLRYVSGLAGLFTLLVSMC